TFNTAAVATTGAVYLNLTARRGWKRPTRFTIRCVASGTCEGCRRRGDCEPMARKPSTSPPRAAPWGPCRSPDTAALSDRTVAARENGRQPFAIDTVVSAINPTSHGKPIEVFKDPPPPCFRTSRTGAAYLVREIGHPVSIGLPSGFPVTGTTFLK